MIIYYVFFVVSLLFYVQGNFTVSSIAENGYDDWLWYNNYPGAKRYLHRAESLALEHLETEGQIEEFELDKDPLLMQAKYLRRAPGDGSCLFHSIRLVLEALQEKQKTSYPIMSTNKIRQAGLNTLLNYYENYATDDERHGLDKTIAGLYFPDVSTEANWGSVVTRKTRVYVLPRQEVEECLTAIEMNQATKKMSRHQAEELVYKQRGRPVNNVPNYVRYMSLVAYQNSDDVVVQITYSRKPKNFLSKIMHKLKGPQYEYKLHIKRAVLSLETTTWGDDVMIQALATYLNRYIAVVLLFGDTPMVLKYKPLIRLIDQPFYDPIVLFMKSTGNLGGGNHYDPMIAIFKPAPLDISSNDE